MHDSAHGTTQPEAAAAAAGSDIPSRGLHCRILYCTVPDSGQSAARSVEACGALHCAMQYAMACLRGEASERARRPAPAAPRAGFCLDLAPALTDRPPQPRHSTTTTLIKNSASAREKSRTRWRAPGGVALRPLLVSAGHRTRIWYEKPENLPLDGTNNGAPPKTDSNGFVRLMITKKKVSRGGCERVPSGQQQVPWSVRTATSTVLVRFNTTLLLLLLPAKVLAVVRRDAALFFNLARAHDRGDRFGEAEKTPIACLTRAHTNNSTAQRSTHSQPSPAQPARACTSHPWQGACCVPPGRCRRRICVRNRQRSV